MGEDDGRAQDPADRRQRRGVHPPARERGAARGLRMLMAVFRRVTKYQPNRGNGTRRLRHPPARPRGLPDRRERRAGGVGGKARQAHDGQVLPLGPCRLVSVRLRPQRSSGCSIGPRPGSRRRICAIHAMQQKSFPRRWRIRRPSPRGSRFCGRRPVRRGRPWLRDRGRAAAARDRRDRLLRDPQRTRLIDLLTDPLPAAGPFRGRTVLRSWR